MKLRDFQELDMVPKVELHVKRLEPAFSDVYLVCSCGYISLPYPVQPLRLICPVEDAEAERMFTRQRFLARLAEQC